MVKRKRGWKRRDPRNKFKGLLEHLDSNFYNKEQRKIKHLKKTFFPYAETVIKQFEKEGFVEEKEKTVNITIMGYKYLDYLRDLEIKNETLKYQRVKILMDILLVFNIINALFFGFGENQLTKLIIWSFSVAVIIFLSFVYFSIGKFIKK